MFKRTSQTQPEISALLEKLLNEGKLPPAILLYGQPCTGRMTCALETADLICKGRNAALVISDRDHECRVKAALSIYRKNRNRLACDMLWEAVFCMLGQYNPALSDAQSQSARKKAADAAAAMELMSLAKNAKQDEVPDLANRMEKVLDSLYPSRMSSAISVNAVRSIRDWCATSSLEGSAKVVIIEGIEDASTGAVNALLKTIEEPPTDTYFILISKDAGRIPATILSRVRKIAFKDMDSLTARKVIWNYSSQADSFSDLASFLVTESGVDDNLLKEAASALGTGKDIESMGALVAELESKGCWDRFYKHLMDTIEEENENRRMSDRKALYIASTISSAVSDAREFNQTPRLCFERIVCFMKGVT